MNLVDLAEMWRQRHDLVKAKAYLDEAFDLARHEPGLDRYAYVLVHRALLRLSVAAGDLAEAEDDLETALQIYTTVNHRYLMPEIERLARELHTLSLSLQARAQARAPDVSAPTLLSVAPFKAAVTSLLNGHRPAEPFRKGSPHRYLSYTPAVMAAVASDATVDPPAPLCVQLEITNQCSTRCRMCFRYAWEKQLGSSARRELSTARLNDLLSEFGEIGVRSLVFSGGEPVVHPDFKAILEHADEQGLHVGILSNGIWPDVSVAEAIVEHAEWIRVSVDGGTPAVYKDIRTAMAGFAGGLSSVERSLESLCRAQAKHDRRCRIGIAYTIQQRNVHDVENMVAFAQRWRDHLGETGPLVVFKLAHGGGGTAPATFLCSEEQLRQFQTDVLLNGHLVANPSVDLRYMREFFERFPLADLAAGKPLRSYYAESKYTCFTPYLFSLVDTFGDVHVCCHLYDDNGVTVSAQREGYCLGNLAKCAFVEIWRSEKYREIRRRLRRIDVEAMPACGECTRHYLPNTAMTALFEHVYRPLIKHYGDEEGREIFEKIVSPNDYPPEVVWF
jgi:MoaA/NifB/PqqE/SkfB family radical SAM enzyme